MEFLKNFETARLVEMLQDWKVETLVNNPWFLGGVGALALLALFMRWRVLLTTILGLSGFVALLSYTLGKNTGIEGVGDDTLLVFVGGGVVLLGFVIYALFIKSD